MVESCIPVRTDEQSSESQWHAELLCVKAAKSDVLPGIKLCYLSTDKWDFFRNFCFVFVLQRNFTILKMLMSPEVSKKDSKIRIILWLCHHALFDETIVVAG